jgi:hypothetical protein
MERVLPNERSIAPQSAFSSRGGDTVRAVMMVGSNS